MQIGSETWSWIFTNNNNIKKKVVFGIKWQSVADELKTNKTVLYFRYGRTSK